MTKLAIDRINRRDHDPTTADVMIKCKGTASNRQLLTGCHRYLGTSVKNHIW